MYEFTVREGNNGHGPLLAPVKHRRIDREQTMTTLSTIHTLRGKRVMIGVISGPDG